MITKRRNRLLDRILRKEEVRRGDGKIYLNRWTLFRTTHRSKLFGWWLYKWLPILGDLRIYVHKFTASDGTKCLHDHPNDLISFIFWNGYSEEYWVPKKKNTQISVYRAPCIRKFPASHAHNVTLLNNKPTWSIVFMYPKKRDWGFFVTESGKRKWILWSKYDDEYGAVGGCD